MENKSNNKNKKISIITICYNEPDVEKTCESIVNQTYQNFEWIVIDGGSNPQTLNVFEKYKTRIDIFVSEPDNGRYNAMNKGIKLATGDYLNFLNAGDYYKDNSILEQVIKNKLDKDVVYGDLNLIKNKKFKTWITPSNLNFEHFIKSSLPHPSTFIKKELFEKYGLYNEDYTIVSDWEKWIVFILQNKCSYKHIDLICSVFNVDGISTTNIDLTLAERNSVMKKHYPDLNIELTKEDLKPKLTFWECLFSLKNSIDNHKIITILGLKIKIKRGNK